MNNLTDLQPVSRDEFARELAPCLALTSGVGMSSEDQRIWLNAAFKALDGIPIALLKRGATAAMKTADHPSKVIPAIMREIEADWRWRQRMQAPRQIPDHVGEAVDDGERAEVGKLMKELVAKMEGGLQ